MFPENYRWNLKENKRNVVVETYTKSERFWLWWIVRSGVLVLRVWFTFQVHFEEIKLNGYDIRYFFVSFWM